MIFASVAFGFACLAMARTMFSVSSTVLISTLLTLMPQVSSEHAPARSLVVAFGRRIPTVGVAVVGSETTYPLAAWQREEIRLEQLARRGRPRRRQAPIGPTPEQTSIPFSS